MKLESKKNSYLSIFNVIAGILLEEGSEKAKKSDSDVTCFM